MSPTPEPIGKRKILPMVKQIKKFWAIVLSVIACSCTEKEPEIIHVSSILLTPTSISITEGQTTTISATISPSNASNQKVIWSSSDASVATVNDGVVVAIKSGNATITAKAEDKIATCDISVYLATGAISLDATHITCRSTELSGKVNFSHGSTDMVFGILYSTSSGVLYGKSENLEATVFDSNYNFTLPTSVLEPETTYYYRSYLSQNGEILYGEVKSFTTLPVSSLIQTGDATDIFPKGATLLATLDLTDCHYNELKFGFEIAPKGSPSKDYKADNIFDNEFSFLLNDLTNDTYYNYRAYVILDGKTYYGENLSFITPPISSSIIAEVANVSYNEATIKGKLYVKSVGLFKKSAVLYYSKTSTTVEDLQSNGMKVILELDKDGAYSLTLSSLNSKTQYFFMVISSVDDTQQQTGVLSFTTSAIDASITAEVTNTNRNDVTISGKLTFESEDRSSVYATLYYSDVIYYLDMDAISDSYRSKYIKKVNIPLNNDGSYSVTISSLKAGLEYTFVVLASIHDWTQLSSTIRFTTECIANAIDLGLSVKWADCNLGASWPEDYGCYFQWGCVELSFYNISCQWLSYKWCAGWTNHTEDDTLTKYCTLSEYGIVDNKTTIEPQDDAAHCFLGGGWRMPTMSEWEELFNPNNCIWIFTDDYNATGRGGYIVKSKKSGFTDKAIFLPAAGFYWYGDRFGRGFDYWSSSLRTADPRYALTCGYSDGKNNAYTDYTLRMWGLPIRPVIK